MVLSAPDEDTARWSAASLGRAEVEEVTEGFSYGANTIRDGVSLTPKRELRPLALASEIMQLPALHGYLRFPGPLPAARVALDYTSRDAVAERFVARRDAPAAPAEPDAPAKARDVPALGPPKPSAADPAAHAESGGVPGEPEWLRAAEDAATAETAAPADASPADASPPAHDGPEAGEPASPGVGMAGNGKPAGPDEDRLRQF